MVIGRKGSKVGAYAEQRYRQGLRRYRSKLRPILAAVLGPFIAGGLAVLFLDGHHLSWCAGALTGILTGVWITFRETPPSYIENWHDGAEGERKTEKALAPLARAGWAIVHDVQARYGNYDHIAVGPAGVFLLETKNLAGIVELHDGVPHLRRRLDPEADTRLDRIRPRVLAAAANLKEDIERLTGWPAHLGTSRCRLLVGLPRRSRRRRPLHLRPRSTTPRAHIWPPNRLNHKISRRS
ncbi:MAG TPA: nuclease-related domain-containing protein [Solirubrobacteraceae bacterium]